MNIVILDGGTTNPGDLSWEPISSLGNTEIYDDTPAELVIERAKYADAILMNRTNMNSQVISKLPQLKYIGTLSTGFNSIDLTAAKENGIIVSNVPFYCVETVAQFAFSLLLELCNKVSAHSEKVKNGEWDKSIEMSNTSHKILDLYGKTLGIIGFGNIGQTMAKLGRALGMNILVYSRTKKELPHGDRFVSLEDLFRESDVVSIHCALNDETRGLVNNEYLSLMKNTAFIINTARGGVINQNDLAEALNNGTIAGAGLDVLVNEPPLDNDPILSAKNCIITPHIAWSAYDARKRLINIVANNLSAFIEGKPKNVVNP